jgi:hypothetical protein
MSFARKHAIYAVKILLCLMFALILCPAGGPAYAADTDAGGRTSIDAGGAPGVGVFTAVEGTVSILHGGKLPAVDATAGSPVYEGDAVRTKRLSRAEISMKDGSVLKIAESTRIDISRYMTDEAASKSVIKLPRGNVRAIVAKRISERIAVSPNTNHFEVHTPNAVAGVRGTDELVGFDVPSQETTLGVYEGRVEFYNKANPLMKQLLTANQASNIVGNKPPALPRSMIEGGKKSFKKADETKKEDKKKEDDGKDDKGPGKADDKGGDKKSEGDKGKGKGGKDGGMKAGESEFIESSSTTDSEQTPGSDTLGDLNTEGNFGRITRPITEVVNLFAGQNVPPVPGHDTSLEILITSAPGAHSNLSSPGFSFSANEPVSYSYSLDAGGWVTIAGDSLGLSDLSEGAHKLNIKAVGAAGNTANKSYSWVADYTAPVIEVGPAVAMTDSAQSLVITSNEPVTYLYALDGATVLSPNISGLSEGLHTATIEATDAAGNVTRAGHTWFVGDIAKGYDPGGLQLRTYSNDVVDITMSQMGWGITTAWSATPSNPATIYDVQSYAALNANPHVIWGGGSGGSITASGGAVNVMNIGTEVNGAFNMKFYGLYLDPSGNAGFLKGDASGLADNMNGPGTVTMTGPVYAVPVTALSVTPQAFADGIVWGNAIPNASNFKINSSLLMGVPAGGTYRGYNEQHINYSDLMGTWLVSLHGQFNGESSMSDDWDASLEYLFTTRMMGHELTGTKWSDGIISGTAIGYRATAVDPVGNQINKTGITVGDVMGTFDPAGSMFQMAVGGVYIETNRLLGMASTAAGRDALRQLGIPSFEVGRTTLKGSATASCGSDCVNSVDLSAGSYGMNNVIFLSPTSGSKPQIWATGDISGAYTGFPVGLSVALSDDRGITANFTLTNWKNNICTATVCQNQWLAKIAGSGTLNGGAWSGPVTMKGAAAGTITGSTAVAGAISTGGTFAGTAAGVVK